jgi:two-component system sensor histidine kinase/response regulator
MSEAVQHLAAGEAESFDPAEALERLDGDEGLLREVVELVQDEWRRQSEAIESAIRRADIPALAAAAHSLKGVVGQLFSEGHSAGVARVERAARAGDLATAESSWRSTASKTESIIAAAGWWARGGR